MDIFSLGIIMYELFSMCPLAKTVTETGKEEEFALYARRVADGHREPLDDSWPQQIQVQPPLPLRYRPVLRCALVEVQCIVS